MGPGMATPMTFCAPRASTAMAATSAESMPPLSPIDDFAEAAFADVIARADDQGAESGFVFVFDKGADIAFAGDAVEEDQSSSKTFRAGGYAAVGHEGDARAVEDQAVVAADLIDVNDGDVMFARDGLQHVVTERALVDCVG